MLEIWQKALEYLRAKVTKENFDTYFASLHFVKGDGDRICLGGDDLYCVNWIRTYYIRDIEEALCEANGAPVKVDLVEMEAVASESAPSDELSATESSEAAGSSVELNGDSSFDDAALPSFPLNPQYTFQRFVVGPNNEMAHAACEAVARNPAQTFNPLFIYGGTGLGKTHMLQAIAHTVLERNPAARVVYISAEEFTNQLIRSISQQRMDAFREHYRSRCDVLLMDDVHVLQGKERTQEEFFHTFNALHTAQKQIVVTSDRPPSEIKELEERIRSRFHWGLLVDVKAPQFETRVAILQGKADAEGVHLPDDVAFHLARSGCANVRELEGALTRLIVFASVKHRELSIELADEALGELLENRSKTTSIDAIQKVVADYYEVRVPDLKGSKRTRIVAHPRSVAMYLCRKHTQASFPAIGRDFGGKDHTTVMSAVRKIEKELTESSTLRGEVDAIERKILG